MRQIIEGPDFARGVEKLGGFRAIDRALETVIEALMQDPYGFPLIENDWVKIRYVRTTMIERYIPELVIAFTINEDNDVILEWIEAADVQ